MNTHIKLIQSIILLPLLLAHEALYANPEAEKSYKTGLSHYQQEKYDLAIPALEKAVKLEPDNAEYQHILAVSYGREAERVNWFSAIDLAKKTLAHLEIAANLDKENLEILDDLMDYYREAPGFLGGNNKKADEIEALIEKLSQKSYGNEISASKYE